jgi:hypothetical protein
VRYYLEKTHHKKAGGVAQVVGHVQTPVPQKKKSLIQLYVPSFIIITHP